MTPRTNLPVRRRHIPAGAPAQALGFSDLVKRAEVLAKAKGVIPSVFENNAPAIVLVGMRGAELGFSLGYSLENIDVIDGKAVPNAQSRLTLIRKHGHEARFTESSAEKATLRARRSEYRDDPEAWVTFTYSIEDARRAELLDMWVEEWRVPPGGDRKKKMKWAFGYIDTGPDQAKIDAAPEWAKKLIEAGPQAWHSKDNWRKDPISMCRAGATRHMCRMEFSDVMAGAGIDPSSVEPDDSDLDFIEARIAAGDDDFDDDPNIIDADVGPAGDGCPVPGCTTSGNHRHDSWVIQRAAGDDADDQADEKPDAGGDTPPADDPGGWDGDRWREVIREHSVPVATALKEARQLAQQRGEDLPSSLAELQGRNELARALADRLDALKS